MRFDQEHDSCTTILVGKKASYDGSTLVARTEDSCNGEFTPKKFIVVRPQDQPRHYKSVISGFETDLPDNPVRYTAMPNAINNFAVNCICLGQLVDTISQRNFAVFINLFLGNDRQNIWC